MFKVVVGHSNDPETPEAIAEVLQQCQQQLDPDAKPQAGVLLAAIDFEFEQLLAPIAEAFPDLELIGGTTDGEISSVLGFEQDSVSLMLFCSDRITIRTGIGERLSESVEGAVQRAVAMASQGHQGDPVLGIALYESFTDNVARVLGEIKDNLRGDIPILGGLTADQWRFKQTYQFYKGKVYSDAVVLLFFSGPLAFSFGVKSGWCPIGEPGVVTKQDSNVLYEIDHRPALAYFQHYIGDSMPSSESPLAVFQDGATDFYLRAP
ncbi:MAG: FIST N-terminal domain-containing protein, partial [Cyanobacteria bacterium P01_H01_bin.130]